MINYSFVVCSFNGESRIQPTLDALIKYLDPTRCEILVINNNSTDKVGEVSQSILARTKHPWRVILEPKPGLMSARKCGTDHSSGNVIVFIDDDNTICNDWCPYLDEAFIDPSVGICGAYPKIREDRILPTWWGRYQASYAVGDNGHKRGVITSGIVFGAGMAVRREAICRFFREYAPPLTTGRTGKNNMAGDDSEICHGISTFGYKLFFEPNNILIHEIDESRINERKLIEMISGFARSYPAIIIYTCKHSVVLEGLKNFLSSILIASVYYLFKSDSLDNRILLAYRISLITQWVSIAPIIAIYKRRRMQVLSNLRKFGTRYSSEV